MFKVIMASNPEILRSINPDFTVEAEYGEILVEGKYGTLAHHGSRSNNPAPCTVKNNIFYVHVKKQSAWICYRICCFVSCSGTLYSVFEEYV